jgi:hypothetical protein
MAEHFEAIFVALKPIFANYAARFQVKTDTAREYALLTKTPSPFPQHEGQPMWFGSVKRGKAYVSFHLMPLYMNPPLNKTISPALKKRMQGKTCFNFKTVPDAETLRELETLTAACIQNWKQKQWM